MTKTLEGVYPAVITTFRDERSLDLDAFAALLERLFSARVDGVYVGGNTGEWYLQSLEERKIAVRTAVEVARGKGRVLMHVGCTATEDSLDLARYAEHVGADGISSLPPYVPRCNMAETINYYRRLASATALPCFIYYFPVLTGAATPIDTICSVPGIRGVKFTDMNLYDLGQIAGRAPDGFLVFNGHDQVLLPALVMGARGGVGSFYNVMPEAFVSLFQAWQRGDIACAQARQAEINRVICAVKKHRLVPALRSMLHYQGIEPGVCREPMLPLPRDEEKQMLAELDALAESRRLQGA